MKEDSAATGSTTSYEELSIQLAHIRLAARAWGPKDGMPVIALHGWLDNCASFDTLAPLLPELRLVALDMAGHGHSDHRESGCYEFIQWIPDVFAAADWLGWQRFGLIGHSLGAAVAICAAGTLPERITRVALIDGLGPLTQTEEDTPKRLATAIKARFSARAAARPPSPTYPSREAMAERLRQAVDGLDTASAQTLIARSHEPAAGGVRFRYDSRLRQSSLLRLTEAQVMAFLKAVVAPTLVVRAKDGWPFDMAIINARRAQLANAELVEIEGPHHVHLVNPKPVAAAVAAHFRSDSAFISHAGSDRR
jgi:pimeloyl-ACP methyl ester carboxylesterase